MPRRLLLALVVAAGCDDGPMAVEGPISVGPCDGLLTIERMTAQDHVPAGSPLVHASNPPNSGPHYPIWAAWDRQYDSLQRGYYIHNAEHGGIVLLYNCDPDCPEVVASLVDVARNMAPDSTCIAPITKRVLIVKDPEMPAGVQVAAVAWNYTYTASCFDPYVTKFAKDHYRNAPEDFCNEGASFGGTPINP
jgi:hypothetical protein